MSRLNPAAVMSSFVGKVRASIQNWRSKKRNEIFEDQSDQLFIENLEERVLLDGSMPGEDDFQASEDSAWFMQLPKEASHSVINYLNSEGVAGSSKIWRPIEEIRQADPDPATGQVSQDQLDELDLSRLVGADSQTTFENTFFDTYSIDQNLWTGLDITTEVKSFAQDDGSYIVVLKRTERDRSFDLGSSGGGAPGGPGSPGEGGSNPFEQVDSDILTTIVQTDDANVVSQIETNQTIDTTAFDRWLTIETDFTFRYEILSDDGFGQREFTVSTDYEIDLDVHWMGLYEHTIVDEAGDGTSGDSVDQLPLGETVITIDYDLIVDADFEGNQSYEATAQLGPGNIGSATFENSGLASGTYSIVSGTTSTDLYSRGNLDYETGQFGIRVELNSNDDYAFNSSETFAYTGNGINTHGSTGASFTSGQYVITSSRTTDVNDQSETEFFYESYLDVSEGVEANAQAEADAEVENTGEDSSDTGSNETTSYYIPTTTLKYTNNYWKAVPVNVGTSVTNEAHTFNYVDGEQDLTHVTSTESSTNDTTGNFYQSSFFSSVFSSDASSATIMSSTDSLLSTEEWVGTTNSQSDLTYTPTSDGDFVVTGFIDDQSSYSSGLVSNIVGSVLTVASVSAALRNDEESVDEGSSSDPGSDDSSGTDSIATLPIGAENYLKNHFNLGFSAIDSANPELYEDLTIRYSYEKSNSSKNSNTQYSPGHNNVRKELENADTMRVISSESENFQVLNQGGVSGLVSDSIVTVGDYTVEDGSFYKDHTKVSSNWHVDNETVANSSDFISVLDAVEIDLPDGSGTTGSGSSDPNADPNVETTENMSAGDNYRSDTTTVGVASFERNSTGEYSYTETENSSLIIVDQRDEQEGGSWTHLEVNDSFTSMSESTTEGDSWSKNETQYFGDVNGRIPIEGRGQTIWERSQVDSDSATTDSSETEFSNSYRYRTHSGDPSLGDGTDIPGGSSSIQSPIENNDTQESYSAKLTSGMTTSIDVNEDLYTLTHRLFEESGQPGSEDASAGAALIEGPTFSYKSTYYDGSDTEITLGGSSDVTITTNYWDNLGDIQSQLSLGDSYSDSQGDLGNDLVFQTGIAPDGTIVVGPDAPNVSTLSSSNVVHKVYFQDDGRYDVKDGSETFSKTTKNKRTLSKEDSSSSATEDLTSSTRTTTFEILDNNAETSNSTVTHTNTYENFGTRTHISEKLSSVNSDPENQEGSSGDGSNEGDYSLDPNDWLPQHFGVEVEGYGTGSHTSETRIHGKNSSSIKTRETIVDTEKDGSGDATRITTKTYTSDKTFDQTDTTEKTFDANGYLEIQVTQDAAAGNNKLEKHQLVEDEFTAHYLKTDSDGGILETTRTGDSTSISDELFYRSVSGSLIYDISYDGTPQNVSGSILTTLAGSGDSDTDDTQTVEKIKTYTGTFSSGDLDPGIVDGHVPLSIQGGGTETGTIEYTISKTEIQKLADNFSGTMTSTQTSLINDDGKFENSSVNSYVNSVDGTKKVQTIAENNYQAFGNLGGTPTIDTGLVETDSYDYSITGDSFGVNNKLGYSVSDGYNSYNFISAPIDAQIGDTFASIPESDTSYASVTVETNYDHSDEETPSETEEDGNSYVVSITPVVGSFSSSVQQKRQQGPSKRVEWKDVISKPIGAPNGYTQPSNYINPVSSIVNEFLESYPPEAISLLHAYLEAGGSIEHKDVTNWFGNVELKFKYAFNAGDDANDSIIIDDGVTDTRRAAELLYWGLNQHKDGSYRSNSGLAKYLDDETKNKFIEDLNKSFDKLSQKPLSVLTLRDITSEGVESLADNIVDLFEYGPGGGVILVYEAVSGEEAKIFGEPVVLSTGERVFRIAIAGGGTLVGVATSVGGKNAIKIIGKSAKKLSPSGVRAFAKTILVSTKRSLLRAKVKLHNLKNKIRAKLNLPLLNSAILERNIGFAPGYMQGKATIVQRKEFAKEIKKLGVRYKFIEKGGSVFNKTTNTVYLNRNTATPGTLLDEFTHAFGSAHGKGKFLRKDLQAIHKQLQKDIKRLGSTDKLPEVDNLLYHQLELLNFLNSAHARPDFIKSIPIEEIRYFLKIESWPGVDLKFTG